MNRKGSQWSIYGIMIIHSNKRRESVCVFWGELSSCWPGLHHTQQTQLSSLWTQAQVLFLLRTLQVLFMLLYTACLLPKACFLFVLEFLLVSSVSTCLQSFNVELTTEDACCTLSTFLLFKGHSNSKLDVLTNCRCYSTCGEEWFQLYETLVRAIVSVILDRLPFAKHRPAAAAVNSLWVSGLGISE